MGTIFPLILYISPGIYFFFRIFDQVFKQGMPVFRPADSQHTIKRVTIAHLTFIEITEWQVWGYSMVLSEPV